MANQIKIGNILIICLFLTVSGQFIWSSVVRLSNGPAQDFEVFYLSGKEALAGQNPYQKLGQDIIRNPPPSLLFFAPLALIPIAYSEIAYFVISFLAFLLASFLLFRVIEKYGQSPIMGFWQSKVIYITLALLFFPLRHDLASGQVNTFLLLLLNLSFYFYLEGKELITSLMLALAVCLKLTPLVISLALLMEKRFRIIYLTAVWLVSLILITTVLLGPEIWPQYLSVTSSYLNLNISHYYNQAMTGLLSRIDPKVGQAGYLFLLALIGASIPYLSRYFKKITFPTSVILWNLSVLAMVLFVPFTWQYHLTIALFPLLMSTYLVLKLRPSNTVLLLIGFSYLLLGWNIKNPILFHRFGIIGSVITSHATIGALILLFLNLYCLIFKEQPPSTLQK